MSSEPEQSLGDRNVASGRFAGLGFRLAMSAFGDQRPEACT
jgi:hypothetical protein